MAAVDANSLDKETGKNTAVDILSSIEVYINKYHPHVAPFVRYGMDHSDTYQTELLDRIIHLFNEKCKDEKLRKAAGIY